MSFFQKLKFWKSLICIGKKEMYCEQNYGIIFGGGVLFDAGRDCAGANKGYNRAAH